MKKKEIEVLESYFQTENEHWNRYAFDVLCEVLQKGQFDNPEIPLELFSKSIDIFSEQYETPLGAVQTFFIELNKKGLSNSQNLFVCKWVLKYLKYSEFEKGDITDIQELFESQVENLKNQKPEYNKPLVGNIRDTLKELIQNELEQMSETLRELEPIQRLNIICKIIPYVLPRVEAINSEKGEP